MSLPTEREALAEQVTGMLANLPLNELLAISVAALINREPRPRPREAIENVLSLVSAMSQALNVEGQIMTVVSLRELSDIIEKNYLSSVVRH